MIPNEDTMVFFL